MASAKMSVTSTIQNLLLNKSLSSMVKGIRNHKSENGGSKLAEQEYINKCLAEIKEELKTNFPDVKAVAVQKLIYVRHTPPSHDTITHDENQDHAPSGSMTHNVLFCLAYLYFFLTCSFK